MLLDQGSQLSPSTFVCKDSVQKCCLPCHIGCHTPSFPLLLVELLLTMAMMIYYFLVSSVAQVYPRLPHTSYAEVAITH